MYTQSVQGHSLELGRATSLVGWDLSSPPMVSPCSSVIRTQPNLVDPELCSFPSQLEDPPTTEEVLNSDVESVYVNSYDSSGVSEFQRPHSLGGMSASTDGREDSESGSPVDLAPRALHSVQEQYMMMTVKSGDQYTGSGV